MTKRTRIFIGILLAYALGVGVLMYRLLGDIDPRYRCWQRPSRSPRKMAR